MTVLADLKRLGNIDVDRAFEKLVDGYAKDLGKSNKSKGNPGTGSQASVRVSKIRRNKNQLTPSQALLAMRASIWKRGWTQGVLQDNAGRMCLRGAIVMLVQSGYVHNDDAQIACEYLRNEVQRKNGDGQMYNFVYWNNEPRRTLAEILKVLEDAGNRAKLAGE